MPCFILQFEYHRLLSSWLLLIHSKMELVSFALSGLDYIFSSVSKSTFGVFQGRSVCPTDMTPLGNTWSPYSKQWEPICYHRLQISDYEDIAILSVCVLIIALQIFLMIASGQIPLLFLLVYLVTCLPLAFLVTCPLAYFQRFGKL